MRTVDDLEVSYARTGSPTEERQLSLTARLRRKKFVIILFVVALAFCTRAYRLDSAGLAEDETNKIFAVRSYDQGDFTANADHPMLMKMLCYGSIRASQAWNNSVGTWPGLQIAEESALRLPNALFGALTVIPLFLFTTALFRFRVGLIAALLWAVGLNAIWINRVVKEDTLLVFFMFTGYYLYHLAKVRPASDSRGEEKLYSLAGAAFGMMMASKYFLHYFGQNALFYHLIGYDSRDNRPLSRASWLKFFAAIMLAFVIFNPAVLVPQTWRYLGKFISEDLITHHGYLVMDTLYLNDAGAMLAGTPWYLYYLFLLVKLPLPLLAAFLVGVVEIFRHRGDEQVARGYLFLRMMLFCWFVPMTLVGSKFLRYTLSLMPLIYMTAAIGAMVLWGLTVKALRKMSVGEVLARRASAAAVVAFVVIAPAFVTVRSLPYPSLYLNALGGGRTGFFFPHDEFYDLGARESIKYVAEHAPPGASIASEVPGVVQYYLERYNRPDIRSLIISHPDFDLLEDRPDYVMLQRGRTYFENLEDFRLLDGRLTPVQASTYNGADATRVYRLDAASLKDVGLR
ncbi:MAG TPA: glycosyltransferase family 39 protein [Blastocatellia bacterium]|nr:glycosyltransferase family 39 protein [Blastocatellia bacterium]